MMNIQNPIDVFTLCSDQTQAQGELPIALLTRITEELSSTDGTLAYTVRGTTDADKHALLHLEVKGELHLPCQRCAEPFTQIIDLNNTLELVHSEAELDNEEEELAAIAAGHVVGPEKIVGSSAFDLLALLEDEIILSLPIVMAHEVCEQVLPTSAGEKASPFDALRGLKTP